MMATSTDLLPDSIVAPTAVQDKAIERVEAWYEREKGANPELAINGWHISSISSPYVYEDFSGKTLNVYDISFSLTAEYDDEQSLVNSVLYVIRDSLVWTTPYLSHYLVFAVDGDELNFVAAMHIPGLVPYEALFDKYFQQALDLAEKEENAFFDSTALAIDVPDIVRAEAENFVVAKDQRYKEFSNRDYEDWRITDLRHCYTYDDFEGKQLQIYQINYEFLSGNPENESLAGGAYITKEGWVSPGGSSKDYLIFAQQGEELTFLLHMENDSQIGSEYFSSDLQSRLTAE